MAESKKKMTIGEIVIAQQKQINALAERTDALLQLYNKRGEVLNQIIKAVEYLKNGMEITVGEENIEPEPKEEPSEVPKESESENGGEPNGVRTDGAPAEPPEEPKEETVVVPIPNAESEPKEEPAATFPPRA